MTGVEGQIWFDRSKSAKEVVLILRFQLLLKSYDVQIMNFFREK